MSKWWSARARNPDACFVNLNTNNVRKLQTYTVLLCLKSIFKKILFSDVSYEKLVRMLLHGWAVLLWISSFFPSLHPSQPLNQTSTFLKSNTLIQTKRNCYLSLISLLNHPIFSPSSQSAGNFVTSFENKVDNILSSHSPSSFLNNSSNFNESGLSLTLLSSRSNVILQLTNQRRQFTLFRDYCDHLPLTSSCIPLTTQPQLTPPRKDSDLKPSGMWNCRHYGLPPFISIQNSQICQLTQYLSQNSLWDPNHTVQAWNATVPAQQWRHQHGRSQQTSWTITLFQSESFPSSEGPRPKKELGSFLAC